MPTGITQNVKDLLISMEVENIFEMIYCKGWMSKQGQTLLKHSDSRRIRSRMKRHSREGAIKLCIASGQSKPFSCPASIAQVKTAYKQNTGAA